MRLVPSLDVGAGCSCRLLVGLCSRSPERRVSRTHCAFSTRPHPEYLGWIPFIVHRRFWATLGDRELVTLWASGQQKLNDSGWRRSRSCFMDLVLPGHRKWEVAGSREMWGGMLVLGYCCSILWKGELSPVHVSSLFLNWYKRCVSLKFSSSMGEKIPQQLLLTGCRSAPIAKGTWNTDQDLFLDSILPVAPCLQVFQEGGREARNSSAVYTGRQQSYWDQA